MSFAKVDFGRKNLPQGFPIVSGGEMWNLTDKLQQWSCSEMSICSEAEALPL